MRHLSEMKMMKVSYLSILCRSSCWAFNFNKRLALIALTPMIRRMGVSSNTSPPEPQLRKVDYQDSRNFNHRGDWGRIAELTDAIYSDPKDISNWKERARLYKESDLPFNAYSDLNLMGLWSSDIENDWQVR